MKSYKKNLMIHTVVLAQSVMDELASSRGRKAAEEQLIAVGVRHDKNFDVWWEEMQPIHVGGPLRQLLKSAYDAGTKDAVASMAKALSAPRSEPEDAIWVLSDDGSWVCSATGEVIRADGKA